ncbi:hypothetical protein L7F22_003990, partial [Adiantum nelumboides]|nr:hypothetical protein [Adiantum nelumboides]
MCMAAAALSVEVGSFADPKDAQGLFHFLGGGWFLVVFCVEGISLEEFENYVEALIEFKLESDHHLTEETDRLWLQITEKRYLFDIHKEEAEELRSMTKIDIMNWYNSYLAPTSSSLRKLTVCVWGSNARGEQGLNKTSKHGKDVLIESVPEFKSK